MPGGIYFFFARDPAMASAATAGTNLPISIANGCQEIIKRVLALSPCKRTAVVIGWQKQKHKALHLKPCGPEFKIEEIPAYVISATETKMSTRMPEVRTINTDIHISKTSTFLPGIPASCLS